MRLFSKSSLITFTAIAAIAAGVYMWLFRANVPSTLKNEFLYVASGSDVSQLRQNLIDNGFLNDPTNFDTWASLINYSRVRPGKYKIQPGWSSHKLIKFLKNGEQTPVNLVVNGLTRVELLAGKAGKQLESDSLAFVQLLNDTSYLDSIGYTRERLLCLLIPNTYQFHWNTTPRQLMQRMMKEHKKFWNKDRIARAQTLNLTPDEVYILASIVDGETNVVAEMPTVAGTYLNRLRINKPLEADPTVQYALMDIHGGGWRRLLYEDYNINHPYNTYIRKGLPPGPVGMPSVKAIDATLNPDQHDYIFFVAQPNNSGAHAFSRTFQEHLIKVEQFRKWMREQGKS
jgi:UPF0755 protein